MAEHIVRLLQALQSQHGFASGGLSGHSVWLTTTGDVLLLGHGAMQLQPKTGSGAFASPEERLAHVPAELPGDPYRLGSLLLELAVGEGPYDIDGERFGEWSIDQSPHRDELAPVADLLETLLHVDSAHRPRGALLHEVIAKGAPNNWQEHVAKLASGR